MQAPLEQPCMPPEQPHMPPEQPCMPPPWTECGHTLLKILPCPDFVAGGKNKNAVIMNRGRRQIFNMKTPFVIDVVLATVIALCKLTLSEIM